MKSSLFIMSTSFYLLFVAVYVCLGVAVPKDRGPRTLSDEHHYTQGNEHNQEFDTEAFLGKEEAVEYKSLSPEESKRRLRYSQCPF